MAALPGAVLGEIYQDAPEPLISRLACSLAGKEDAVIPKPGSIVARVLGEGRLLVKYTCSFGLNEAYRGRLEDSGLLISALDDDGQVRAAEIPAHPFFVGTLFMPQLDSAPDRPHPLITAFLKAAAGAAR